MREGKVVVAAGGAGSVDKPWMRLFVRERRKVVVVDRAAAVGKRFSNVPGGAAFVQFPDGLCPGGAEALTGKGAGK